MAEINGEVVHYLRLCQEKLGLKPEEMRVLDYGCGSGQAVLSLRSWGYQAFGVDVDGKAIQDGRKLLCGHGFDGENILFTFDENTPIPFHDQLFHYVMSQEVIEHVRDIGFMAQDLRRVAVPGGLSFHAFRPQFNLVEPHFYMPFVHWLPKNRLRKYVMLLCAYLGIGMHPPEIPGAGPRERAEFLYRYSVNQTFYRPYPVIGRAFREAGFTVSFPASQHRKIRGSAILSRLLRVQMVERLFSWLFLTFWNGYLLAETLRDCDVLDDGHKRAGNERSSLVAT